jgi:polysaccharide pyruvyl transferase
MKIGILTHHYVVNFGAFMQAYALQEAIRKFRPDDTVEIINYIPLKHFTINTLGWFIWYKNRKNWKNWRNIFALPFTLRKERKKHMKLSSICLTAKAINKQHYDIIVVGSDEVWNFFDSKSFNPIKFGYGIEGSELVSYAPSIGQSELTNIPDFVLEGLKKFSAISARDNRTAKLAEIVTGKSVPEVLDPTFLLPLPQEQNPYVKNKDYILFYYCEHLPEKIKHQIFEYAKEHNLEVLGAGDSDKDYEKCTVNMTPFEWIDMFRHAKFVFTGTFHGAVFSILNHCQFKVYLTNKGRIAKVGALLDSLGVTDRLIDDNYVFDLTTEQNEIDYSQIQETIDYKLQTSIDYLKQALS